MRFPIWLCVWLVCFQVAWQQSRAQERELPNVVVAPVIEQDVRVGQRFIGTVQPNRRVTVGTALAGRIRRYLAREGDWVEVGDVLAELDTESYEIQLAAAKAEHELAQQELLLLENGPRPEEIDEAKAAVMAARAANDAAKTHLARIRDLIASGTVTAADLEAAQERANTTAAQLAAAEAVYRRIVAGPRAEEIGQARARKDLAWQKIKLLEYQLSEHQVIAPFRGVVSMEHTEQGAWVTSGAPICEIVDLDTLRIEIPVPPEVLTAIHIGDTVRVEFPSIAQLLVTGQIERVVPVADPQARTFPLIIRVPNDLSGPVPRIPAGIMARVELPAGPAGKYPLVPKDALVLDSGHCQVFLADLSTSSGQEGIATVRSVPVELGVAYEDRIQVIGQLRHGQYVVVLGNERLTDGLKVRVSFGGETDRGS